MSYTADEFTSAFQQILAAGIYVTKADFKRLLETQLAKAGSWAEALMQAQEKLMRRPTVDVISLKDAKKTEGRVFVKGTILEYRIFQYRSKKGPDSFARLEIADNTDTMLVKIWTREKIAMYESILRPGISVLVGGTVRDEGTYGFSINAYSIQETSFALKRERKDLRQMAEMVLKSDFVKAPAQLVVKVIEITKREPAAELLVEDTHGMASIHVNNFDSTLVPGSTYVFNVLVSSFFKQKIPTPRLVLENCGQVSNAKVDLFSRRSEEIRENSVDLTRGLLYNLRLVLKQVRSHMQVGEDGQPYNLWINTLEDQVGATYGLVQRQELLPQAEELIGKTFELSRFKLCQPPTKVYGSSNNILRRSAFSNVKVFA